MHIPYYIQLDIEELLELEPVTGSLQAGVVFGKVDIIEGLPKRHQTVVPQNIIGKGIFKLFKIWFKP